MVGSESREPQNYILDSKWMHHPSITGYVTSALLDTDLAPLLYPRMSDKISGMFRGNQNFCRALYTISEELDSGCYDASTHIKRFQEWEIKGYNIHSLVYPLLRLHTCELSQSSSLNPNIT